jgi:hypothetical protein
MRPYEQSRWYHCNRYSADSACEYCGGVIRHEPWCVRRNRAVSYAYAAARNATELTLEDQLILHALGVTWTADESAQVLLPPGHAVRK